MHRGGEGGWMSGKWIPGEVPVLVSGHVGFRTTDSSQGSYLAFLFRLLGSLISSAF